MGDILGGNAFQVCLFLVADIVAGQPVLQSAGPQNAWLAALGIALTAIDGFGVIIRPDRCRARLGPDSIVALVVFTIGIAGLFFVSPVSGAAWRRRRSSRGSARPVAEPECRGCRRRGPTRTQK